MNPSLLMRGLCLAAHVVMAPAILLALALAHDTTGNLIACAGALAFMASCALSQVGAP